MGKKNGLPDDDKNGLPDEIHVGAKTGKRPRDEEDSVADPSAPSTGSKKTCTNMDTPLSPSSAVSTSHSVAKSILSGSSKKPPRPPPTPPPPPKEVVKIICFGSDSETRKRWIKNLLREDGPPIANTPPLHSKSDTEPCVLGYDKKEYTFQSVSGEEKSVLIQFLHLDGLPNESPPSTWEATRDKLHAALLIIDLRFMISLWEAGALESHLEERKIVVGRWTHDRFPVNLLLANVWHEPQPIPPAILLRVGDAIAQACRKLRIRNWFLVGPESDSSDGLDSIDAVLQSLVKQVSSNSNFSVVGLSAKSPDKDVTDNTK
eukprot:scaffold5364_cov164-Amphora_coffeaeformis.AAC.24